MIFCQPDQLRHLRAIPLEAVLPLCGAHADRRDRRKWHTSQGVLSISGPKFMNWHCGVGGGGAIDLVMHLNHWDFKAAVDWLADHFPAALPLPPPVPSTPRVTFQPPPSDPSKLGRVKDYLVRQRAIAPALLEPLLQSGTLYADTRANAVFLLLGKENIPVGAELRGTTQRPWRGLAAGSQKDLGFFSIPAQARPVTLPTGRQVILCESAIDAISCFALHRQYRCLSTAGARPNPRWLRSLLDQGGEIYCGFDADPVGDAMARALIALHPTVKRFRPVAHDWNNLLRARA
jgi:hypothetical protein